MARPRSPGLSGKGRVCLQRAGKENWVMSRMMSRGAVAGVVSLLLTAGGSAGAFAQSATGAPLFEGLGKHTRPVATAIPGVLAMDRNNVREGARHPAIEPS